MTISTQEVEGIFKTLSVGGDVAVGSFMGRRNSDVYMYYKFPATWADGSPCPSANRIIKAQASPTAYMQATMQKQLIPLPYGRFPDNVANVYLDPFRKLFLAGGAKEFSIKQVRESFWHRRPPVYTLNGSRVQVVFPQLTTNPDTGNVIDNGVELQDFRCPDCPGELWFVDEAGMRAHMATDHKAVAAQRATAHEMGEATKHMADALSEAQGNQNTTLTKAFDAMTSMIAKMHERQLELEKALANNVQSRPMDRPNRPSG